MVLLNSYEQWLLSIDDTKLHTANQILNNTIQFLSSRSDVEIIRIIGSEILPRVVVFHASTSTVEELKSFLDSHIIITLDKPLNTYNNTSNDLNVHDNFS